MALVCEQVRMTVPVNKFFLICRKRIKCNYKNLYLQKVNKDEN